MAPVWRLRPGGSRPEDILCGPPHRAAARCSPPRPQESPVTTPSGIIFVNPGSGRDETSLEELRRRFPSHVVQECRPEGFVAAIKDAVAKDPAFIGAAGGDGTIRTVVQELIGTGIPLLVVPAGTRNHFAKDLGIEDLDGAEKAAAGRVRSVDVGSVNGTYFVNNSSIGVYPKVVVRRELHERRLRKGVA